MLKTLFQIEQGKLNHIQFVNVTKLRFGNCDRRSARMYRLSFFSHKQHKIFSIL
jgi:hypothetical protein